MQNNKGNTVNYSNYEQNGRGRGTPCPFGGLHKGFLLRNPELTASPRIPGQSPSKGQLTGKNPQLHSACTLSVPEDVGRCQSQQDRELPWQQRERPAPAQQSSAQGEQRSKLKLKCQDILRRQSDLHKCLDQLATMDWDHPDVEAVISKHPQLPRQMQDPRFARVLTWLRDDPEGFLQHFEDNDEEVIFVRDLLEIIGELLQRNNSQGLTGGFLGCLGLAPEDQERLNAIADHPEIRAFISDPAFRKTLSEMSRDPEQAERILESCDRRCKGGMATLLAAGVMDILLGHRAPSSS